VEVPLSLATLQDQASTARRALAIRGYAKGGYAEDLEAPTGRIMLGRWLFQIFGDSCDDLQIL